MAQHSTDCNYKIIFGANGFIGKNFILYLKNNNLLENIILIVSSKKSAIELKLFLEKNQINNQLPLFVFKDFIKSKKYINRIQIIFNFMWINASGENRSNWQFQYQNILLQKQVLGFAKKMKCKKIVTTGSIAEDQLYISLKNDEFISKNNYYSLSKYLAHFEAKSFCNENNIILIWLKITNAYGPYEKSPRLINSTLYKINSVLNLNKPTDFIFSSGIQLYDFIYVEDCVSLIWLASQHINKSYTSLVSSNNPRKLKDYLEEIFTILKCDSKVLFDKNKVIDMYLTTNDLKCDDLIRKTKYKYKWSFKKGIITTFNYIESQNNEK